MNFLKKLLEMLFKDPLKSKIEVKIEDNKAAKNKIKELKK